MLLAAAIDIDPTERLVPGSVLLKANRRAAGERSARPPRSALRRSNAIVAIVDTLAP